MMNCDNYKKELEEKYDKWDGYFTSGICDVHENDIRIRGYALQDLMGNYSYGDLVALTLKGELPDEGESIVTDAILSSIISHGFIDSSEAVARYVAAGNPNPIAACAAGILGIGFYQAGATRYVAEFINEAFTKLQNESSEEIARVAAEVAKDCVENRRRIPGFGHPIHTSDPRAIKIFELAEKHGKIGPKTQLYCKIHEEFMRLRGKKIVINADGAVGAILADFGYDPMHMEGLVAISFLPGILASAIEEIKYGVPFRVLPEVIAKYTGVAPREVPIKSKK